MVIITIYHVGVPQVIFQSNLTRFVSKGVERDAGAKRKKAGEIVPLMD